MANLNVFADPSVPGDTIPGIPVPICLITHPYAKEIAHVTTGVPSIFDKTMNPLDLFQTFGGASPAAGVAVVILNSLPTPITLVECYAGNLDDQHNGPQISYPAVIDGVTKDVVQAHQVPGVRTYPYPTLHLEKDGSPSLIGGVGLYRFQYSTHANNNIAARALAFSYNSDAQSGPLIGISFDHQTGRTPYPLLIGIQADLGALGQATTAGQSPGAQ